VLTWSAAGGVAEKLGVQTSRTTSSMTVGRTGANLPPKETEGMAADEHAYARPQETSGILGSCWENTFSNGDVLTSER